MKREELIAQVKEEYSNFIAAAGQQHFHKTASGITPEAYYTTLQNAVITEINKGKFDNCRSGREVVNIVAADKSKVTDW
jgi:hypothetical protein